MRGSARGRRRQPLPDARLRVGVLVQEALDVGFAIEDLGYHWYEDPLGAEDLDGYVRLKQHLSIPIVATEITSGGVYALP